MIDLLYDAGVYCSADATTLSQNLCRCADFVTKDGRDYGLDDDERQEIDEWIHNGVGHPSSIVGLFAKIEPEPLD